MVADTYTPRLPPATVVSSDTSAGVTGARPLGPATAETRMTFAGGIVTLGECILIALAVPFMVAALPVVLLAWLLLTIVRARSR